MNINDTRIGAFIVAALSGLLLLAACGGGDDDSSATRATGPGPGASAEAQPEVSPDPASPAAAAEAAPGQDPAAPEAPPAAAPAAPAPAERAAPAAAKAPAGAPAQAKAPPSGTAAPAPAREKTAAAKPAAAPGAPAPGAPVPGAPAPPAAPGASDVGISATEIKTGGVMMHGMPLGNLLVDPMVRGMHAVATSINDAGGIHGRKLKYISCDDGPGETSRAMACMKKLVEQDRIFAFLTSGTWSSIAMTQNLERYKIPLIGAWAYGYVEWTNPWSFPAHMSMLNEANAGAEWVRDVIKPKTFGLICLNAPEMQRACGNVNQVLSNAGATMVDKIDVSLTPGDLSAEVIAMRSKNPDHIVHYVINPASIAKFVVDSAQQRYWPPKGISGNHLAAELLGEIFGQWPVGRYWTNTTYKLWGPEYMAVIRKYAPNNEGLNHHIIQAGVVATNIFAQGMKQLGPEPTREKLIQLFHTPGTVWDAGPDLDQKFMWAPGERFTAGTAGRREFMYKYTDANTVANKDASPHGFTPDPDKFVIEDTQPTPDG